MANNECVFNPSICKIKHTKAKLLMRNGKPYDTFCFTCPSIRNYLENKKSFLTCPECGKDFEPARDSQVYCSNECRIKATRKQNNAVFTKKGKNDKSDRRVPESDKNICKVCGNLFIPNSRSFNQVYCSPECRKTAQKKMNREWHYKEQENKNMKQKENPIIEKQEEKPIIENKDGLNELMQMLEEEAKNYISLMDEKKKEITKLNAEITNFEGYLNVTEKHMKALEKYIKGADNGERISE